MTDLLGSGFATSGIRTVQLDSGKILQITQLAENGLAGCLWNCGLVTCHYLYKEDVFPSEYLSRTDVHVLELGSGTGLCGIALALRGAHVTLTDLPADVELMRYNVQQNIPKHTNIDVTDYFWGDPVTKLRSHYDLIIASDLSYEPRTFDALVSALDLLCDERTVRLVILAYEKRKRKELQFFEKLKAKSFTFTKVPDRLFDEKYTFSDIALFRIRRRLGWHRCASPALPSSSLPVSASLSSSSSSSSSCSSSASSSSASSLCAPSSISCSSASTFSSPAPVATLSPSCASVASSGCSSSSSHVSLSLS